MTILTLQALVCKEIRIFNTWIFIYLFYTFSQQKNVNENTLKAHRYFLATHTSTIHNL